MRGVSAHHFYDWLVLFLVLESRDGLREDSVALDEENEEQDELLASSSIHNISRDFKLV